MCKLKLSKIAIEIIFTLIHEKSVTFIFLVLFLHNIVRQLTKSIFASMMKYFTYIIRKHIHNGFKKEKQTNKQTDS